MVARLTAVPAQLLILLSLAACDVFLPDGGGSGQPCIENPSGQEACRGELVCCAGTCLPTAIRTNHFTNEQIMDQIDALFEA